MDKLVSLYAQFLNDGISLVVNIMSPIWNGATNSAYSLSNDGAGILERIKMWTNEYLTGEREGFQSYFSQNIEALRNDRRYVNNKSIQEYCNKYEQLLNSLSNPVENEKA